MATVLVTAATGRIGTTLVPLLRGAGHRVLALTRRPDTEPAARLAALGAEPVAGDYRAPEALKDRLPKVDAVFLATADAPDQDRVEAHIVAMLAARGRPHVVKLSAQSAGLTPPRSFGVFHRRAEEALARSGLPHTILRPTFFQQSLLLFAGDIAKKGKLIAPAGRGRVAMVDVADIARAAAAVLGRDSHHGQCYTLSGPSAHGFGEVAAKLTALLGRRIRYASPPAFAARLVLPMMTGMPRWQSNLAVDLFVALRAGAQAVPTDAVERLTGRPAASLDAFLADNLLAFRA